MFSRIILTFALFLLPATLFAQMPDITLKGGISYLSLDDDLSGEEVFETTFSSETSWTAGVNIAVMENVALDLAAHQFTPSLRFRSTNQDVDLGETELTPITAILQYRFGRFGMIEPFLGAGLAWVKFGDLDESGIRDLQLDDDTTWTAAAGFDVGAGRHLRFGFEAKYLPFQSVFTAAAREPHEIEGEPLIVSATAGYRF